MDPVRVEINAGGRDVTVEAAVDLDTAVSTALTLWRTIQPAGPGVGGGEVVGFAMVSEPAAPQPLMPPEIQLPARLNIPEQETPDERRDN